MHKLSDVILSATDDVDQTGSVIDSGQLVSASFQTIFGDTDAEGTVKIQASNDVIGAPTHWSDITNASAAVTAGVAPLILIPSMSFKYIRAVYTSATPGATTINVSIFAIYP